MLVEVSNGKIKMSEKSLLLLVRILVAVVIILLIYIYFISGGPSDPSLLESHNKEFIVEHCVWDRSKSLKCADYLSGDNISKNSSMPKLTRLEIARNKFSMDDRDRASLSRFGGKSWESSSSWEFSKRDEEIKVESIEELHKVLDRVYKSHIVEVADESLPVGGARCITLAKNFLTGTFKKVSDFTSKKK